MDGYVVISCQQEDLKQSAGSGHRARSYCTYAARADNFYFPRIGKCADATTCATNNNLNLVMWVPSNGTNTGVAEVDPRLWELGAIKHDMSSIAAGANGIKYENDGSCKQPREYTWTTTSQPNTFTEVGTLMIIDDNNYKTSTKTAGSRIGVARYHDSHFLSVPEEGRYKNFGRTSQTAITNQQISPEFYDAGSILIMAQTAYTVGTNTINTPVGCCKLEHWNDKSFQRYFAKALDVRDENCYGLDTAVSDATTFANLIQSKSGWRYNTFLFENNQTANDFNDLWGVCDHRDTTNSTGQPERDLRTVGQQWSVIGS